MHAIPPISVVIPCHNAAKYIEATLRSVFAQQEGELEVLMVDDGSTDGSAELVMRSFPQVRVLRQANQGVAAARNHGIEQARHDWVAFVDADDIWVPGKLRAQWALLQQRPDARMCYTGWKVWPTDDVDPPPALIAQLQEQAASAAPHPRPGPSGWIYPELLIDCVVWTSTVLVQRSLLREVAGFDVSLRVGEDYDLWLRLSRLTPILHVPCAYALYRLHPANLTKRVPAKNYKGEVVTRALARWGMSSPEGRRADVTRVKRGLARSWADFAGASLLAGHAGAALRAAARSVTTYPWQLLAWQVLLKAAWCSCLPKRRS
jgi:glycosyltransferase involved in cell wall biosynthesis